MEEVGDGAAAGRSVGVVISAKQRARISENYRAAKALLDRKRCGPPPYSPTSPTIHQALPQSKKLVADHGPGFQRGSVESRCKSSVPHKLLEVNRVPLQEMEANTCKLKLGNPRLPLHANFGVPQPGTWLNPCNKSSIHGGLKQINKSEEVPRTVPTIDFPSSCLSSKDSSQDHRNNVTPLNSLIEEFDESFLQEIDTMLEQKYLEGPELRAPIQNGSIEQSMDPCAIAFRQQSVTNHDYTDTSDMSTETQLLLQDIHVHASAVDLPEKSTETLPALVKEEPEISAHELSTDDIRQTAGAQILASGCELTVPSKCVSSDSCLQEPCFMANQNHPTDDLFSKYFQTLNDMQREAATSDITVPLMIVAGPGSGKTSTIVGRVLMLLKEGIAPSNILAMTFTTAAASEMRERIGNLAGKSIAKEFTICTFHSLCLQLCRAHAEKLQRTSDFSIYGTGQQRRAVIEAVRLTEMSKTRKNNVMDQKLQGNSTEKDFSAISFKKNSKKWQKFVAMAKASGKTVNDYHNLGYEQGAEILRHYDNILKSCNALDYYDFISLSLKLLTDFPEVHKQCQDLWKAIVVDEFQDTSALQYHLLRVLGSHHCITVVGDEDQSIFSFNGADVSGFDSFRKDFPGHKEVRLQKNYRSTRCIVEASLSLIQNNKGRCHLKQVMTDNDPGSKISIIECHSEDAQCSFVIDKIMEMSSEQSVGKCSFGSIAILYRRQVSGRLFQSSFRNRKIPFNVHGVAFYRKKVVKAIVAMLKTALPGCEDGPYRQVFKALFLGEKAEKKKVVDYIDKVSAARKCSFFSTACDVFTAKVSGTFTRNQLNQGRKVLLALDMISKLVQREPSISLVVSSIANLIPQKYLLDQRAVVDADGGKLLNEDSDLRNVMQYLLDDVSEFLRMHCNAIGSRDGTAGEKGCIYVLKMFIDYVSGRENDNFRSRRIDNENSVSLTTIHQSKGLEWDTVFIIKANDCEIPLLHDADGFGDNSGSVEEERRLLYVAMTRARKRLYILYALMDANWQVLQPSRFLKELPPHLLEIQDGSLLNKLSTSLPKDQATTPVYKNHMLPTDQTTTPVYKNPMLPADQSTTPVYKNHMLPEDQTTTPVYKNPMSPADQATTPVYKNHLLPEDQTTTPVYKNHMLEIMKKDPDSDDTKKDSHGEPIEIPGNLDIDVFKYENEDTDACIGNHFLRRFNVEDRSSVSHLFHTWAKKQAFQDPKRLLDKVGCVVDERLRSKKSKNKSILQALRSSLKCDEAFQYAQYVLTWEEIPADKRAQIMREKQEYFQKLRIEASMSSSAATPKQISYLQKLGCAITPTSRLHASNLIEQYKSL